MEFKVGDKVLCVRSEVDQFKVGKIYEIFLSNFGELVIESKKGDYTNYTMRYRLETLESFVTIIPLCPAMEIMYGI